MSAVRNENHTEFALRNCEIRSWPEYAMKWHPSVSANWNQFANSWVLANEQGGIVIDGSVNGGSVDELDLQNCILRGGQGAPALDVVSGVSNLNINGGRVKNADAIRIADADHTNITGLSSQSVGGNYAIQLASPGPSVVDIKDCQIQGTATNAVDVQDGANITIAENTFDGFGTGINDPNTVATTRNNQII